MWIERDISDILRKAFAQFPGVVFSGARQTGKTSLVQRLFSQADYVTFDIPREAESARLVFSAFLQQHSEPLIIDEVQYVPEVFRFAGVPGLEIRHEEWCMGRALGKPGHQRGS